MKIDLTCPVELWQSALPKEEGAECTFILNNLSSKVVTSVLLSLSCFDKDNKLLFRQSERMQGLRAGVGERFTVMLMPNQWKDVAAMELSIEKVWFDDATLWRRGNAPLISYQPNALSNGRALDQLRFVAGQDAVGYPQRQPQCWVCVCGRANPPESSRCCRCERNRESVFASYGKENVAMVVAVHEQKLDQVARQAREENSRLLEEQSLKRRQQLRKKRALFKGCLSGACLAAVLAVVWVWVIPTLRYNSAVAQLDSGRFEEARTAFAQMKDYGDAAARLLECDYREAAGLLQAGDEESLLRAEALFTQLSNYQDSDAQKQETAYQLGQLYLKEKRFDQAMDKFQGLKNYRDSQEMCNRCVYQQAEELLTSGNQSVALALYATIPSYQDAAAKALVCYYQLAQEQVQSGNDEEAARLFRLAGEYEDADEQFRAATCRMADAEVKKGDLKKAGELYLSVSDDQNALAKGNDCLYQYAQERMKAGDYEAATAAFDLIPTYLDSDGQAQVCRYQQAAALMEKQDYAAAAPLLERAGVYSDAQKLLDECNYYLAKAAMESGDLLTAETLLSKLNKYQDSPTLLKTVRYQTAQAALDLKDYAGALERLEKLGEYEDSPALAQKCRYELAKADFIDEKYSEALAAFTALGEYEDSPKWMENAAYQLAVSYEKEGKIEAALELLPKVSKAAQATDKLTQMLLNEGARLESEDQLEQAAELYQKMGEGEIAVGRYNACRYQMAKALLAQGETRQAGDAFLALGAYEDAAAQAQSCYDALYAQPAAQAREAMDAKAYADAIRALKDVERENLPEGYTDLAQLYLEACYQYADELYRDGLPYQAMPFYQEALSFSDARQKLERRAYLILGSWVSSGGSQAIFRTDGTCQLLEETLFFRVSNFSLYTGKTQEDMILSHQISRLNDTTLNLRDLRDGKTSDYRFTKTAQASMPPMQLGAEETSAQAAPSVSPSAAPVQATPSPTPTTSKTQPAPSPSPKVVATPTLDASPLPSPEGTDDFQVTEE